MSVLLDFEEMYFTDTVTETRYKIHKYANDEYYVYKKEALPRGNEDWQFMKCFNWRDQAVKFVKMQAF